MTTFALPTFPVECFANPAANRMTPYGARRSEILSADALTTAQRELTQWQGYAQTPLHSLPALAQALQTFYEVRDVPGLKKKPSTSEFLDWLKLLLAEDIPAEALRSKDNKAVVPPLHGALLKNEQDVHLFERLMFMSRTNR